MDAPKSRMIPFFCGLYALVAATGLFLAMVGYVIKPDSLRLIDETGDQAVRIEQARQMAEQAQQQQPVYFFLTDFYKGWLLESDFRILSDPSNPLFGGSSVDQKLLGMNDTAILIDSMYQDSIYTLALLSAGSLYLILLMFWVPSFILSAGLAVFPLLVAALGVGMDLNVDPLGYCWVPFGLFGCLIFLLQLVYSFRYGRQRSYANENERELMAYRRGMLLLNLGFFMMVGALLMATESLSGGGHSARALLGLALFGEDGIVFIGAIVGAFLVLRGLHVMRRKPSETDLPN